ncbi:GNAT family N-acetyltransferase [Pontibacter sp. E15-1]|uniref:GNAT family N-acetyltransferase n=1 Tax=Pontibacter sp. E15-1 TaxID=2919918 RepID=UPI001F4F2F56|nr:GNAT family N-acetyltransferase [Pontibacter sp. E15-1]MCJ8165916.1 GNAT family N-acetyltransferase [Pontibacter sp. E15-1]
MIRAYTPADEGELIALLQLNIPRYFHPDEESDFVAYLLQFREDYFVMEENRRIIGAGGINYVAGQPEARISWDIIHPDFQGQGIGTQLMLHRINHIKQMPTIRRITVRTSQLVYPFYEKMGFVLERTEKDFWAKGFDLYQLKMTLD